MEMARENNVPIHEDREMVAVLSMLDIYQELSEKRYKGSLKYLRSYIS